MKTKKSKLSKRQSLITVFLCAAVVFGVAAVVIHQATKITNDSYAECAIGDINGDGHINSIDALLILQQNTSDNELFENQIKNADTNADGELNSSDAIVVLRYAVGEISNVPPGNGNENSTDSAQSNRKLISEQDDVELMAQVLNEWSDNNGEKFYQLSVTIKNNGTRSVYNPGLILALDSDAEFSKCWDCECEINGTEISVKTESVSSGENLTCGFIISAGENISLESISLDK